MRRFIKRWKQIQANERFEFEVFYLSVVAHTRMRLKTKKLITPEFLSASYNHLNIFAWEVSGDPWITIDAQIRFHKETSLALDELIDMAKTLPDGKGRVFLA